MMPRVPQIRFKGFSQEWRTASLSTVAEIIMGQSPKSCNYTNNPKDHILVQGNADMKNGYVVPRVWTTEITKTAKKGDLIMSVRAPVGDIGKTNYDIVIGRGVAAIRGNEFIFQLLVKKNIDGYWINISSGSTFDSITSKDLATTSINFPPQSEEQEKIGNFFRDLDELIELKQKAYDKLLTLKKAFLSKMFPQHGANVPQIRFKGFSDSFWLKTILENELDVYSGRDYKHLSEGTIPVYGTGGYMLSVNEALSYKDGIGIGRKGTIDKPYLLKAPFWTVDTLFYTIPKSTNNIYFCLCIVKNIDWKSKDESTGVPSLSKTTINNIQLQITQSEEQEKIGNFFQKIDALIDLRKTELTKLKNIKKACLNKMFV